MENTPVLGKSVEKDGTTGKDDTKKKGPRDPTWDGGTCVSLSMRG